MAPYFEGDLAMAIWIIANGSSFRDVGNIFGLPQGQYYAKKKKASRLSSFDQLGTVHFEFLETVAVFKANYQRFIKWPERREYEELSRSFRFPGAIGRIF